MTSYCEYTADLEIDNLHRLYHDKHYGFPVRTDNELFGRLILEINQAGLSWSTILKKQKGFKQAYAGYDIAKIARFKQPEIDVLLDNPGIIRNRLKINAIIHNAKVVLKLKKDHGSFKIWLAEHAPLSLPEWVKLFRKNFKFTGGEITKEFLVSTGYVSGAHQPDCPIYAKVCAKGPAWLKTG